MTGKFVIGILAALLFISPVVAAQADQGSFPLIAWVSKNVNDVVTIQNGSGTQILILISVNGGENASGINVANCGLTKHINPGSATVCSTKDAANPVGISSDNSSVPASGTYQIKQQ